MPPIISGDNVRAACPDCGTLCTFEAKQQGSQFGELGQEGQLQIDATVYNRRVYRLLRCGGCGRGGIAVYRFPSNGGPVQLHEFYPMSIVRAPLPAACPAEVSSEFREAELCASAGAWRAATAMLRSALEKTLKANGYTGQRNLEQRIDEAAADGVITAARQRRAHDNLRVLGNNILHDAWRPVNPGEYEDAHLYAQRIIEDFYDSRAEVVAILQTKGRLTSPPAASAPTP